MIIDPATGVILLVFGCGLLTLAFCSWLWILVIWRRIVRAYRHFRPVPVTVAQLEAERDANVVVMLRLVDANRAIAAELAELRASWAQAR